MSANLIFNLTRINTIQASYPPPSASVIPQKDAEWHYKYSFKIEPLQQNKTNVTVELCYRLCAIGSSSDDDILTVGIETFFTLTGEPPGEAKLQLLHVWLKMTLGILQGVHAAKTEGHPYARYIPTEFDISAEEHKLKKSIQNGWA